MDYVIVNAEVLYPKGDTVSVSRQDVARLKLMASENPRRRIRFCTHESTKNSVHEMIIVHAKDAYVRPHRHNSRCESFHVIEGRILFVTFDEKGSVGHRVVLGEPGSGNPFYLRIADGLFHTVVPLTDWIVFHETTKGPFRREDTEFASWSPDESDVETVDRFIRQFRPPFHECR